MNYSRISAFLGILAILFGLSMTFALPWTHPILNPAKITVPPTFSESIQDCPSKSLPAPFDYRSFFALINSMVVCFGVGGILLWFGRKNLTIKNRIETFLKFIHLKSTKESHDDDSYDSDNLSSDVEYHKQQTSSPLLRREAIAIVGLSWILTGILGALPFCFAHVVRDVTATPDITLDVTLKDEPQKKSEDVGRINADIFDCLFESFSGITGFGASVLGDVENPEYIPKAIQFWRCELHFLGGLGIMVLFVAILGGRAGGKSLMLTEMPHNPNESPFAQARKTAFALLGVYLSLNTVLIILLFIEGMPIYDAVCHSFSAVATGGFSSKNSSVSAFNNGWIELTLTVFMFISSCNFMLLYFTGISCFSKLFPNVKILNVYSQNKNAEKFKLLKNTEVRVFTGIVFVAILLVSIACWLHGDCATQDMSFHSFLKTVRYAGFQVVSIISSTGFNTHDFSSWNDVSRGILFALMFTGGCIGSTTCGLKVMRLIVLWKTLGIEIEKFFRPNVVRSIHLQGESVEDTNELRHSVLSYFSLYCVVFAGSCLLLLTLEPTSTWTKEGLDPNQKMYDCITAVTTTYNSVGPSFGIATDSFGAFHAPAKCLFILLMLLGRLELYVVFAMLYPKFWKT